MTASTSPRHAPRRSSAKGRGPSIPLDLLDGVDVSPMAEALLLRLYLGANTSGQVSRVQCPPKQTRIDVQRSLDELEDAGLVVVHEDAFNDQGRPCRRLVTLIRWEG